MFGHFGEKSEKVENNDVNEKVENTDKPKNQILESPKKYEDKFSSKLDVNEVNEKNKEVKNENLDKNETKGEVGNATSSLLDRMKNLFDKKERNAEKVEKNNEANESLDKSQTPKERNSFIESLRKDSPSYKEQAEKAKSIESAGKEEYLEQRAKSERAYVENPNKKSWELSSEQMEDLKNDEAKRISNMN